MDSAAASGGQGRITSLGVRLRQDCRFQIFISYSHAAYDLIIFEINYPAITVSTIFCPLRSRCHVFISYMF
jgi:hypothetical protein